MKFNYRLSKICGTTYASAGSKHGANVLFYKDTSLLSPAGNRIHVIDLRSNVMRTLPIECRSNISCISVCEKTGFLIAVDVDNYAVLMKLHELTAVELHRFRFKRKVRCVEFSPHVDDGAQYFAVGYGKHVQIWRIRIDQETGGGDASMPFELHRTCGGFAGVVVSLQWSPDGSAILASSRDNTAQLLARDRSMENRATSTFAGHKSAVVGAFFGLSSSSNIPNNIYTVSIDGSCFTWSLNAKGDKSSAETSNDNSLMGGQQSTLDFFTGSAIASSSLIDGLSNGKSYVENLCSKCWKRSSKHYFQQAAEVTSAAMNPAGLLVVGFTSGVFGLYEMPGCTNVHTLSISNRRISSATLNSAGDWLAIACPELGQLLVWEWQSETYVLKQQGHSYAMRQMAFSPDGSQFVATGGEDGKVKMWNADSGFCFVTFSEHTAPISAVAFASSKVVLSSSLDGTVRAYDLIRYKNFRTMTTPTPVQFCSMALDSSGEIVCAGTFEPFDIYTWSLQTGKILEVLSGHSGPVAHLSFSPNQGKLASASWDGTVKLWDVFKKNIPEESFHHQSDVVCVAFRPDGNMLVSGTTRGQLVFWDVEDGKVVYTIDGRKDIRGGRKVNDRMTAENNVASRYFTSVCFSADGACVLAGGNSKYVCIYEVSHQILLRRFQISFNRSLDGVLDKLNSKYMGDGGPVGGQDDSADEAEYNIHIPGAKRNDDGSRRSKLEVLTSAVGFSPSGREWATVSNEGLHIFELDDDCMFDPVALTENVTPDSVRNSIQFKEYAKALLMSLHLNEVSLVQSVVESVPMSSIPLVVKSITSMHLERFFHYISIFMGDSPHIEYYLEWCLCLLKTHGGFLQRNCGKYMRAFRLMHRIIRTKDDELRRICDDNRYNLEFVEQQSRMMLEGL